MVIPGGNVNFFVTSLGGEQLPKVGNVYPQIGRVIHLPYVFFGLGRTNNYVNELTVTIPYVNIYLINFRFHNNIHINTCGPLSSQTAKY